MKDYKEERKRAFIKKIVFNSFEKNVDNSAKEIFNRPAYFGCQMGTKNGKMDK